ncbi:hypothetical protein GQ54DRAFT_335513 [Martensiomyces pterosporus]|nr:hypothetical protein GQ54DRAFT_335513 [Martensiomyces pterosporus]
MPCLAVIAIPCISSTNAHTQPQQQQQHPQQNQRPVQLNPKQMPANTAIVASALLALALPATAHPHSHLHSHLHARLQQAPLAKRSNSYGYDTTGYGGYDGYGYGHAGYYPYGYSGHGYGAYAYGFPAALDFNRQFDRTTNRADFHDTTVFANNKEAHVASDTVHDSATNDFVG